MDRPNRIAKSTTGAHPAIGTGLGSPIRCAPHEVWNASVMTPYAARTDSRLASTALAARTSERSTNTSRTNDAVSTASMTSHRWSPRTSVMSTIAAVGPVTARQTDACRTGPSPAASGLVANPQPRRYGDSPRVLAPSHDPAHGYPAAPPLGLQPKQTRSYPPGRQAGLRPGRVDPPLRTCYRRALPAWTSPPSPRSHIGTSATRPRRTFGLAEAHTTLPR